MSACCVGFLLLLAIFSSRIIRLFSCHVAVCDPEPPTQVRGLPGETCRRGIRAIGQGSLSSCKGGTDVVDDRSR